MNTAQVAFLDFLQRTLCLSALVFIIGCGKTNKVEQLPSVATNPTASENKSTEIVDKTFDDIKFEIEPDARYDSSMLTDEIRALDGQRIRIRGYILPTARKRGLKEFVLVRDNQECCFGPGAALFDCILVNMVPAATAEFSVRPVAVEGEFELSEFIGPDGTPLAIYRLLGEKVK